MLRVTQDVVEIRRWAEARGARPCRAEDSGRLVLAFRGDRCPSVDVGWDEFEPAFLFSRLVLVYDDAPGSQRHFVGPEAEAHAFVAAACAAGAMGAPAPPRG